MRNKTEFRVIWIGNFIWEFIDLFIADLSTCNLALAPEGDTMVCYLPSCFIEISKTINSLNFRRFQRRYGLKLQKSFTIHLSWTQNVSEIIWRPEIKTPQWK